MLRTHFGVVIAGLAVALVANGQLNSGSTGADGALNLTTPGTIVFDPTALGLDTDGDNVFNFTTINIGPGVTVKLTNAKLKGKSVIWLASGAVTISGTIDLNGDNGQNIGDGNAATHLAEPGPGGFHGGFGGTQTQSPTAGSGPGGGGIALNGGSSGGGGHAFQGNFNMATTGLPYGNAVLVPLRGGSGGAGAIFAGTVPGGSGGAGGGALRIFSSVSVALNGTITANGGDGGSTSVQCCNYGGGGSGGGIHVIAPVISGTGTLNAQGGRVVTNPFTLPTPTTGPSGSVGRIRLEASTQNFTGTSNPTASMGAPYQVPLPTNVPSLRVVTVNGIAVPPSPAGTSNVADVTVNTTSPIPVALEAKNIPLGTVIKVNVISDAGGDSVVNSTPLAGTLALSTASATVQPQPGFTRLSIRATW